jgi:ATP-dependent protease Clp ATPase subunit
MAKSNLYVGFCGILFIGHGGLVNVENIIKKTINQENVGSHSACHHGGGSDGSHRC